MIEKIKNIKWGYGLMALSAAIVGALVLSFNTNMMSGLAIAIGIVTILGAVAIAVHAIMNRSRSVGFFAKVALASSMLIAGIVMLCMREAVMGTIISVIGLLALLDGAFKLYETVTSGNSRNAFWWIMIGISVLIIACGYVTVRWADAEFAVFLLGGTLIACAVANLLALFRGKRGEEV